MTRRFEVKNGNCHLTIIDDDDNHGYILLLKSVIGVAVAIKLDEADAANLVAFLSNATVIAEDPATGF